MTLVIMGVSADRAVVTADRQVSLPATGGGFKADDSEFPKAGTVVFSDARAAFVFAGLAEAGQRPLLPPAPSVDGPLARPPASKYGALARPFNMRRELMGAILDCGKDDRSLSGVIERLPRVLTTIVKRSGVRGVFAGLTVGFAGYAYRGARPACAFYCLISNTEVRGGVVLTRPRLPQSDFEFFVEFQTVDRIGEGRLLAFGNTFALGDAQSALGGIATLLDDSSKPSTAVAGKSIDLVQQAALAHPLAGIGRSVTSVVVPASFDEPFQYYQEAGDPRDEAFEIATVNLNGSYARDEVRHSLVTQEGAPLILDVPHAPKNAPCPCGSGRKFSDCHGGRRRSRPK